MSSVTKTTGNTVQGLTTTSEVTTEEVGTGGGIGSQIGQVPDPDTLALLLGESMALTSFAPVTFGADFETRLAEVTDKLKTTNSEAEKSRVNNEMETKKLNLKENEEKMEKAQEKMDAAEGKGENGDIWNKISIAFQMLGAVLMAALGAALIATGVGGPAGALMIAGAVLMMVSAINSIVAASTEDGLGIGGSIAKASGADMETAGNVDMGVGITLAVATAVVAIAATVVSGGAAGPALVGVMQNLLSIGSSVASTAGAVSTAVSTGYGAHAASLSKDGTEIQAKGKQNEAFMQQLDDLIDQAMTLLMSSTERFNAMMDSVTEMAQDNSNTLSNTRFAG